MATTQKSFTKQLKLALKKYHDPFWLGEESPLAAPYFLGAALTQNGGSQRDPTVRGNALQKELSATAEILWGNEAPHDRAEIEAALPVILQNPGSNQYSYFVLELRYFQRFFKPRRLSDIWDQFLGQSRAEFLS